MTEYELLTLLIEAERLLHSVMRAADQNGWDDAATDAKSLEKGCMQLRAKIDALRLIS